MSYTIRGVEEIESSRNDPSVRGNEDERHYNRRIPVVSQPVLVPIQQRGAWPSRRPVGTGRVLEGYNFGTYAGLGAASNLGAAFDMTVATRNIDAQAARVIAAVPGMLAAIDRIPPTPAYPNFKNDFKTRPVSAMLNLLTPIENLARETVNNAVQLGNIGTLQLTPPPVQGIPAIPAVVVKMGLGLPPVITDPTVKEGLVRLLTVQNWMILGYMRPQFLAAGFAKALVDESRRGIAQAAAVGKIVTDLLRGAQSQGFSLGGAGSAPAVQPGNAFIGALVPLLKSSFPTLPFLQDLRNAVNVAANDTLMAKPVVDAFVAYVAKMGPLYAGLAQLVWDQKVLNDVWSAGDNIKSRAASARGKVSTPAVKAVLDRIVAGVDKIKNSGTALDNTRKNLAGQPVAKQRVWAEAAVRFPQDAVAAISLQGVQFGRVQFGSVQFGQTSGDYNFGASRGLDYNFGAVVADDAAVAAGGAEAGATAVTAAGTGEVAAPAAAPPVATGIGAAVTAASEAAVTAAITTATAAAVDKGIEKGSQAADTNIVVPVPGGGGIPGLPGQPGAGQPSSTSSGGSTAPGGGGAQAASTGGSGGGALLAVGLVGAFMLLGKGR